MNAPLENVSVPPSAPRVRDDLISPDPLLDCLIEVARLHGQAATRASLSAGLPLQPQEPLPLRWSSVRRRVPDWRRGCSAWR